MPIDIRCTGCRQKFRVADKHAGREVDCPKCGEKLMIPSAIEEGERSSDPPAPPPYDPSFDAAIFSNGAPAPQPPPMEPLPASTQPVFEYVDGAPAEGGVDKVPIPPAVPSESPIPTPVEPRQAPTHVEPGPAPPVDPSATMEPTGAPADFSAPGQNNQPPDDAAVWTLLSATDQEFGPVTRAELDTWFAQGRIDSQCQIFCEDWPQWKWADAVYPHLSGTMPDGAEPSQATGMHQGGSSATFSDISPSQLAESIVEFAKTKLWLFVVSGIGFFFSSVSLVLGLVILWRILVSGVATPIAYLFVYLVTGIVIGFVAYLLLRYGLNINRLIGSPRSEHYHKAVKSQRLFWQHFAIALSIYLAIAILGLIGFWLIDSMTNY